MASSGWPFLIILYLVSLFCTLFNSWNFVSFWYSVIEPTKTTTSIATTILTPSIQSFLGLSDTVQPKTIETIAATINIRTIKSCRESHTNVQKWGTGSTNILFEPKNSSLFSVEVIPLSGSVFNDDKILEILFFSLKYFKSSKSVVRSLYFDIISTKSCGLISKGSEDIFK